jgi:hypothetical protein
LTPPNATGCGLTINRIDELLPWNLDDDLQPIAKAA